MQEQTFDVIADVLAQTVLTLESVLKERTNDCIRLQSEIDKRDNVIYHGKKENERLKGRVNEEREKLRQEKLKMNRLRYLLINNGVVTCDTLLTSFDDNEKKRSK